MRFFMSVVTMALLSLNSTANAACTDFSGDYNLKCYQEDGHLYDDETISLRQTGCEKLQWGEFTRNVDGNTWTHDFGDVQIFGTDIWNEDQTFLKVQLKWQQGTWFRTANGTISKLGDTVLQVLDWIDRGRTYCLLTPQ
ncbi:MAG: hypothetical protein KDD25_02245 [Bdellovibrionales bacterium]|nr:hypothetical protein [Bdellovibrionales bacterium]